MHSLHLALLTVLSASLALGMPVPISVKQPIQIAVRHRLLSFATGQYVSVTKSGRVHANGAINFNNPAKDATPLVIDRLQHENHLRIASVKYAQNGWFLVITPDDTIRAQVPLNGNEVLEEVHLPGGFMALRVVNYNAIVNAMDESSGDDGDGGLLVPHAETSEATRECYIGFSLERGREGRVGCYDSTDYINVRLHIIPHE